MLTTENDVKICFKITKIIFFGSYNKSLILYPGMQTPNRETHEIVSLPPDSKKMLGDGSAINR